MANRKQDGISANIVTSRSANARPSRNADATRQRDIDAAAVSIVRIVAKRAVTLERTVAVSSFSLVAKETARAVLLATEKLEKILIAQYDSRRN